MVWLLMVLLLAGCGGSGARRPAPVPETEAEKRTFHMRAVDPNPLYEFGNVVRFECDRADFWPHSWEVHVCKEDTVFVGSLRVWPK